MRNNNKPAEFDRSSPPKPGTPKDVHFPEYFETVTDGGINVLVIENHKIPAVSIRLVFKNAGSFFDGSKPGLATMTSELLTKGTLNRNAEQVAEDIDFLGASLASWADWDGSFVSLSSLKKHLNKAIDVLADVVLNPVFKEEEINRVKEHRISSIIQGKDDTSNLADKLFNRIVFDNHPYAEPPEGNENSIRNISNADITEFYNKFYSPQNLILSFVGAISVEEALSIVNDRFSGWKSSGITGLNTPADYNSSYSAKNIYIADKPGAVQSSLKIGHTGIERNNPDYTAVTVMNTVLGGYFGSRINYNLREKHGYTYGARSGFNSRLLKGDFSVETDVRTEVSCHAAELILGELKSITENLITDDEMKLVKNYLSGTFPLQLETANAVASKVINLKLYELEKDYYDKYISNINRITKEDILTVAQKYIHPDNCYVVLSGNAEMIKNDFSKSGNVVIFDENGNQK